MEQLNRIMQVIRSLKMTYGDEFFISLTRQLHEIIHSDYTFIATIDTERMVSSTISFVTKDGVQENFEYALEYTPCSDVSHDAICVYQDNVCNVYPQDQLLIDMNIVGYVGVPLHSSKGEVVGLVVALFENEIENSDLISNVFQFFDGRISAELERSQMFEELKVINSGLESRVKARTHELEAALESLKSTQNKMIEQEKQASLGRLVAGVAHEINTPLSVGILASTTLENTVSALYDSIKADKLTKKNLETFCFELNEASTLINYNLSRAAELVVNFKQISSEQINDELITVDLNKWMLNVVKSISPLAKKMGVALNVKEADENCQITTYTAKLYQVVNNIVTNAIHHAFRDQDGQSDNVCSILIQHDTAQSISIVIEDNGNGIDEITLARIYEPFFTTSRGQGGTGLGMSIVYSLVSGPLKGNVDVDSELGKGTRVTLALPRFVEVAK